MWYFQVRYDSRVVIYDRRAFIRLATGRGFGGSRNTTGAHQLALHLPKYVFSKLFQKGFT